MKSEWKEYALSEVCSRLSSGKNISSSLLSSSAQVPVYGGNGIRGYTHAPNFSGECALVGRQGVYCGNVRYVCGDAYITEHAIVAQAKPEHDTRYLSYLLSQMQLGRLSAQSAQPGISVRVLSVQKIVLPPLLTQRKIAAILSSLDDKIENNNAICRNLEEQADAVFQRSLGAKFNQVPFFSLIEVQGGGTPKTSQSEYWNGEIPFFTPKDVRNPFVFETIKSLTQAGLSHCNSPLYPSWTTFVTARGTVGKLAIAGCSMAMNQSCYALVGKDVHPLLVYFYARSVVDSLRKKSTGSVFDAIVTRDFETESINRIPNEKLFVDLAMPMYEAIHKLLRENMDLAVLRDTLLPKLMSGEIDVDKVSI